MDTKELHNRALPLCPLMSKGITISGNYTWSKMIEENGGGNQIGGTATTNPTITDVDRFVQRSSF